MQSAGLEREMSKKVFLHIGMHKTGTTALQIFLFKNEAKILNYHYPSVGRPSRASIRYGHHDLPWSLLNRVEPAPDVMWRQLLNEIKSAHAENIVLSSEEFDGLRSVQIGEMRRYLSDLDVKVIVYLRRQDEFVQASYSTTVRKGKTVLPFDAYLKRIMGKLDYYKLLMRWADDFGKENVCVRVYSKERLVEGDTIKDFCSQIGIASLDGLFLPGKAINRGLPRNVLEIMRLINGTEIPKDLLDDINRIAQAVYPDAKAYDIMSPGAAKQLVESFISSNERVLHEFLGGKYETLFPGSVDCMSAEIWDRLYGIPYGDVRKTIADLKKFVSAASGI